MCAHRISRCGLEAYGELYTWGSGRAVATLMAMYTGPSHLTTHTTIIVTIHSIQYNRSEATSFIPRILCGREGGKQVRAT